MQQLPALPEITDEQYAYLVDAFTEWGAARGIDDPGAAYVSWSIENLVAFARQAAMDRGMREVEELRRAKAAEIETMLADLLGR